MRFRKLTLVLSIGSLLTAYACSDDATSSAPSSAGVFPDPDGSAAGSGGSSNQADASANPAGASNGNSDAAASSDAGVTTGDASTNGSALIDGDGYGIVYSAQTAIGIDQRPDCSATFDEEGNLIGYEASATEQLALGDATLQSTGGNGQVAWGTWVGGPTTGVFYANTTGEFTFGSIDDGFHYAIGKTATTLPTGLVTYELIGGTAPTLSTGSQLGTLDSATVVIDFDSGVDGAAGLTFPVGLELVVTTEAGTITYETTGGTADLSATEGATFDMSFYANQGFTGGLRGMIVDDGNALAVAYVFEQGAGVDGGPAPQVRGALGLQRQ
jgi:hypothetical protein